MASRQRWLESDDVRARKKKNNLCINDVEHLLTVQLTFRDSKKQKKNLLLCISARLSRWNELFIFTRGHCKLIEKRDLVGWLSFRKSQRVIRAIAVISQRWEISSTSNFNTIDGLPRLRYLKKVIIWYVPERMEMKSKNIFHLSLRKYTSMFATLKWYLL